MPSRVFVQSLLLLGKSHVSNERKGDPVHARLRRKGEETQQLEATIQILITMPITRGKSRNYCLGTAYLVDFRCTYATFPPWLIL